MRQRRLTRWHSSLSLSLSLSLLLSLSLSLSLSLPLFLSLSLLVSLPLSPSPSLFAALSLGLSSEGQAPPFHFRADVCVGCRLVQVGEWEEEGKRRECRAGRDKTERESADGRAKGNEGRKEVECMRSIACKRGEERDDRKRLQVVIWRGRGGGT